MGTGAKSGDPFPKFSSRDITQQLTGDLSFAHLQRSQRAEALEQADGERGVVPRTDTTKAA